ncbi:hypothetical protein V8C35DRAFT_314085 [Trichoderma chlorosporum]
MNSPPDKEKQLMMDPVEFWSSQMAPKRPSSSASQRPSARPSSKDGDDPLLMAPPGLLKAPDGNGSRQSRIAVVLKSPAYGLKSPAYMSKSPRPQVQGESASGSAAAASSRQATPSLVSRAKKETPVPLPRPLVRTSTPVVTAPIRTPVPLPKPLVRTATPAATAPVAPVVAPVMTAARTPVPLPKQLMKTSMPTTLFANTTTFTPTSLSAPPSSAPVLPPSASVLPPSAPAPVPGSQPSAGRGRPKGWKPGMSYTSVRASPSGKPSVERTGRVGRPPKPKTLPIGIPKRRGRPPKAPSPLPWQVYRSLPTSFAAFLCEWSGCKAELHNLDTLRRHVSVVHCRKPPLVCRWGNCAQSPSLDQFPSAPSLRAHIEKAHLVPFSWHIGDGPQNYGAPNQRLKEEEIPDYLKDDQGNQVTPSIHDQEVEDFVTWKHNRQKLKDLLVRLNENLPSEESDSPVDED